jgi:hypothetical protein
MVGPMRAGPPVLLEAAATPENGKAWDRGARPGPPRRAWDPPCPQPVGLAPANGRPSSAVFVFDF